MQVEETKKDEKYKLYSFVIALCGDDCPQEKEMKKAKCLSEETLQIAQKRREAKS